MKALVMFVIGTVLSISLGEQAVMSGLGITASGENYALATTGEEIAGSWYSFPAGTQIRFNDNGRVDFGVSATGEAFGYTADTWSEGERLFISFAGYDAEGDACQTAVGVYEVQRLDNGTIRFAPQQDACQWRANILNGHPDLGFDLVFHAVE
jgi:hypothetical protein